MNNNFEIEQLKKIVEDLKKIMIREHLLIGIEFETKFFWQKAATNVSEINHSILIEQQIRELVKKAIGTMFKSK